MQEIKETQATQETISLEEAQAMMKQAKAALAQAKKDERKSNNAKQKEAKKAVAIVEAQKALDILNTLDEAFNRELAPVKTRLQMFINGERYTRIKGGDK